MKVFVIGGTGAFGARLCDLLARDGHAVTIGSRSGQGDQLRDAGRFSLVTFDRAGPLGALQGHDVIVDAAGPFHTYGDDPYRIARAAIAQGAHYLDLSDNADFCEGISVLEDEAKAAGVTVLSGLSSVPAISSAAVEAMCDGQTPLMIESAILPGNKAPRGRAVVESILNQTGQTYLARSGGVDQPVRSWSQPRWYEMGEYRRQAWRIEVPDQRLFPAHFDCDTVRFRAGLELGVMRYGLGVLSWLRSKLKFPMPSWLVSLVMVGAKALAPFGTDRGGMSVEVVVPNGAGFERRMWRLHATKGDGPYVPGIAVRAACRDLAALPSGARAALSVVPLAQIEACFEDLEIETDRLREDVVPVFRQVLGRELDELGGAVAGTHDAVTPRHFRGGASVEGGSGLQARIAAFLFGFPPSSEAVEVEVYKDVVDGAEVWTRRFEGRCFRSVLRPTERGMSERFGIFTFDLDLKVEGGKLHFPVKGGRCLGVPIPKALLPQSEAVEAEFEDRFTFDVHLKAPTGATLVHYRGWLEPAGGVAG